MQQNSGCNLLILTVTMAPPACDFPEFYERDSRVTTKKEIKSHPGSVKDEVDLAPAPSILPVVEEPVELYIPLPPPPTSPVSEPAPAAEPPMEVPKCFREPSMGACPSTCVSEPPLEPIYPYRQRAFGATPPPVPCEEPTVDDALGLDYGIVLGIFILGALTGSSILYAFSKPVIVYAASGN